MKGPVTTPTLSFSAFRDAKLRGEEATPQPLGNTGDWGRSAEAAGTPPQARGEGAEAPGHGVQDRGTGGEGLAGVPDSWGF